MTPRRRRLVQGLGAFALLALAAALVLLALRENVVFFYTPAQLAARERPPGAHLRIGGVVEDGSVRREAGSLTVRFVVAEGGHRIPVVYSGLLPDLFRESQQVVATGRLDDQGVFRAHEVLARHDETYQPPETVAGGERPARPAWVKP